MVVHARNFAILCFLYPVLILLLGDKWPSTNETKCGLENLQLYKINMYPADVVSDTVINSKGIVCLKTRIDYNYSDIIVKDLNYDTFCLISFYSGEIIMRDTVFSMFNSNLSSNLRQKEEGLNPILFNPELQLIHFECTRITKDYWEVIIDQRNDTRKLICIDTGMFVFRSWDQYLLSAMILHDSQLSIFEKPTYNSERVVGINNGSVLLRINSIDGEWVHVNTIKGCAIEAPIEYNGWVKWVTHGKLILTLYFSC